MKNLTITCGSPAVPTIKAKVIAKVSISGFVFSVYSLKPSSVFKLFNLSKRYIEDPSLSSLPKPNCGIGFPVI